MRETDVGSQILMTSMILLKEGSADTPETLYAVLPSPARDVSAPQLMFFPSGSDVAAWFHRSGMAEKDLIMWAMNTYVSADACFLDVGAHVGTYTWTCGKKALHTYAFECSPRTFCYLAANVALHDLTSSVTLFNCALGAEDGRVSYFHRSNDGGGSGISQLCEGDSRLPREVVEVRRLDSLDISRPIGFVKLDVEGAERDFFLGAAQTLERSGWPPVLFESWGEWKTDAPPDLRANLFHTIERLGYSIRSAGKSQDMFLAIHP